MSRDPLEPFADAGGPDTGVAGTEGPRTEGAGTEGSRADRSGAEGSGPGGLCREGFGPEGLGADAGGEPRPDDLLAGAEGLLTELEAAERQVWEALRRGDTGADLALLAPGFLGVYASGFASRADHAGQLAGGPTVADYRLSQLRALPLGFNHGLLSYRAEWWRPGAGGPGLMLVSSVWRRRAGGGWENLFSQDTALTK